MFLKLIYLLHVDELKKYISGPMHCKKKKANKAQG